MRHGDVVRDGLNFALRGLKSKGAADVPAFASTTPHVLDEDAWQRLWNFSTPQFVKAMSASLIFLGYSEASSMTAKSFRAGRAHAMASQGSNLKEILQAGEWKSKAFLAYVDQNALEEEAVLNHVIAGSDDEIEE